MADWLSNGGFGFGGVILGYLIPAIVTRKKDAGDQANELIDRLSSRLKAVEEGHEECQRLTADLRLICTRNDIVIRLVLPELHRVSPYSTGLQQARDLLGEAFPIHLDTPLDMSATLDKSKD